MPNFLANLPRHQQKVDNSPPYYEALGQAKDWLVQAPPPNGMIAWPWPRPSYRPALPTTCPGTHYYLLPRWYLGISHYALRLPCP